jgi:hypothetical protein
MKTKKTKPQRQALANAARVTDEALRRANVPASDRRELLAAMGFIPEKRKTKGGA